MTIIECLLLTIIALLCFHMWGWRGDFRRLAERVEKVRNDQLLGASDEHGYILPLRYTGEAVPINEVVSKLANDLGLRYERSQPGWFVKVAAPGGDGER